MKTPQEVISELLTKELGVVTRELWLSRRAFANYSQERMNTKYGENDPTPVEILAIYEARVKEVEGAIEWLATKK